MAAKAQVEPIADPRERLRHAQPRRSDIADAHDRVADPHAVPQPVVRDVDGRALDPEHLADQRSRGGSRCRVRGDADHPAHAEAIGEHTEA